IHTSTSEVYGTAMTVPIDEQHPLQGQSPYSASKIGADKMAESFYCSYKLPVVTLRPFNTYGPRQSARAVIPTIITQALTRKTIRLGNLDARRDMTYVSDTVNGFLKVAQAEGVEGQVFNLGTGTEVTVRELADRIVDLVGCKSRIVVDDHRLRPAKSEVQRLLSNNGKAADMLVWKPLVSLEQGLSKTIEWIRNNLERYRPNEYQI
ncbi:MAG TPA: GDP-mannose 4,6-dehydratase, partial [Candidatus Paceibacterota bacterium]|nr:GDP-mannose 4,6-dehydratase [Candidatus Paceibacterota bacterium]